MRGIRTFVSEHPIQLKDPLESAYQATLQEQFRRDPKVQVRIQGVGVCDERAGRGAARKRLQNWRFHFEKAAPFQR